ncbi:PqqD family protein [bacterium]|nr:PqqD family protein [bacterium]
MKKRIKNKNKEKETTQINLLDLVPVRNIEWEKRKNGLVSLLKPKFKNPILAKYVLPRLKNPYYRIKLDEIGTCVWTHCDGGKTVREIADILYQNFGKKVEPLHDRLSLFLQRLEKNGFIKYKNLNQTKDPD